MDDFGTGYSSLSYLQSFPFDKIKIDRSCIENITEGVSAVKIVRAITAMARGLGMTTTAEGVETQEQRAAVGFEGCTESAGLSLRQTASRPGRRTALAAGEPRPAEAPGVASAA
jgi:EAL domain-containing protein (putative c-di-GMP-specific phosphodiesterase class I)